MAKSNLPKIQHYVPRLILNNFCIGNTAQIFVFDKSSGRVFKTNIKNIAAEKGFYDLKIEEFSATMESSFNKLEGESAHVINNIIERGSLNSFSINDKKLLSYFIAAQFTRVKQIRHTYKQVNNILIDAVNKMGFDSKNIPDLDYKDEDDFKVLSILGMGDLISELAPYFFNKDWILFEALKDTPYYISDNPVTLQNHIHYWPYGNLGLAVRGIEIYFPISKYYSIGMICRSYREINDAKLKELEYSTKYGIDPNLDIGQENIVNLRNYKNCVDLGITFQSKSENVINKNALQVIYSSRYLFSGFDDFELAKIMIKDHPEYKHPPQIQHIK